MDEAPTADPIAARNFAARSLPLEGGRNFRDLGGYAAADGRRVRRGLLFRSGSMAGLTEGDVAHLATLGIRTICDLRSTGERAQMPNPAGLLAGRAYWSRDYPTSFADLRALMASGLGTAAAAREAMLAGYRRIPFEMAPAYAEIFRRLLAGEVLLAFNCSAGKDRAGIAAALVLTALGVSRADVMADYALTTHANLLRSMNVQDGSFSRSEMAEAVFACDPAYAQAAFDAIEAAHGTVETYLDVVLGVSAADVATLRERLLD